MTKVVTIRFSPELDRRVRVAAAERDQNRTEFIIAAVESKLKEVKSQSMQQQAQVQAA